MVMSEFSVWLRQRFFEWNSEQDRVKSRAVWAKWLGVRQQSLNAWMNGKSKPKGDNITRLVAKLGAGVYEALGIEMPKKIDRFVQLADVWKALNDAAQEELISDAVRLKEKGETYGIKRKRKEARNSS